MPWLADIVENEPRSIAERFELIDDKHGEGAFGRVAKHRDRVLDRLVAVKRIRVPVRDAWERLAQEARTLARLSHPNIPAVYDIQVDARGIRIYLEFIEGRTLRSIIEIGPRPETQEIRIWFAQIASALAHAHALGIIHRDVKPDNIIVAGDRHRAYLGDFDIALLSEQARAAPKEECIKGTPLYLAPEQREGRQVSRSSDLYSLGVTLHEALTGRLPCLDAFGGGSAIDHSFPPVFDDLIKACLAPDPSERLSSAAEFLSALGGFAPMRGGLGQEDPAARAEEGDREADQQCDFERLDLLFPAGAVEPGNDGSREDPVNRERHCYPVE
jgi:serine/threonine protein kinase